jgi:hypothetical protein
MENVRRISLPDVARIAFGKGVPGEKTNLQLVVFIVP